MRFPFVMATLYAFSASVYAYVGWRLLGPSPLEATALAAAWALVFVLPGVHALDFGLKVTGRAREKHDRLSWLSYILMGAFALTLSLVFARDVLWVLALIINAVAEFLPSDPVARDALLHQSNLGILGLSTLGTIVGFVEARRPPRIKRVQIPIENLPSAFAGFKIAQLTDVHIGPTIKGGFLEELVARLNALDVDAVAITGDLVDGHVDELRHHMQALRDLDIKEGAFFVTGNHEYYAGAEAWVRELKTLGLDVLMNEHRVIERDGSSLVLGGVTDYNAGQILEHHESDPQAAFADAPDGPRVLLAHQPRSVFAAAEADVDVQLSGHTHGGQFVPWNFFVPLQQPFVAGLERHADTWVYTSRGTGYWGPPLRLLAPSEISVVELVPA